MTNQVQHQVVVVDDQRIEADLVLSCIGLPPNKKSIESLLPLGHIDENGRIKVENISVNKVKIVAALFRLLNI